jgi:hypothetical protein
MKTGLFAASLLAIFILSACHSKTQSAADKNSVAAVAGSFAFDLAFLKKYDSVIVLKSGDSKSQIIVSPKYQAKVFTSTASGEAGLSFGWVNYKAFADTPNEHMNAFGGEDRIWLGPEGGRFSLFFAAGAKMEFKNWKTPAAFDRVAWQVTGQTTDAVSLQKDMKLTNYQGTNLEVSVERTVKILSSTDIQLNTGIKPDTGVNAVAYQTNNVLFNMGQQAWTETTGMPCIWMLDMLKTTPSTVIVVPYKNAAGKNFKEVATTGYFGEIAGNRLKHDSTKLFFKADGNNRGKLGIKPAFVKPVLGSYDAETKVLTITTFTPDTSAKYLNQEWNTIRPPFSGDAVNAYNDGPLADGSQMGPFYEIESVSPAAFLQPGESIAHRHTVYHFSGSEPLLDAIAQKMLGVTLAEIKEAFK